MQKQIKTWWDEHIKRTDPKILDKRHENKTWNPVSTIGGLPNIMAGNLSADEQTGKKHRSTRIWLFWAHLFVYSGAFKYICVCVCVPSGARAVGEISGETRSDHSRPHQRQKCCSHWTAASCLRLKHEKMCCIRQPGCGLWTHKDWSTESKRSKNICKWRHFSIK